MKFEVEDRSESQRGRASMRCRFILVSFAAGKWNNKMEESIEKGFLVVRRKYLKSKNLGHVEEKT